MTTNTVKVARRDGLTRVIKGEKAEYVDELRLALEVADMDVVCAPPFGPYYLANMLGSLKQEGDDLYVMHQPEYAEPDGMSGWRDGRIYKCSILELPPELAAHLSLSGSTGDRTARTEVLYPLRTVMGAALPAKFIYTLHVEEDGSYQNYYETDLAGDNNDLRFFAYDGFAADDVSITYVLIDPWPDPPAPPAPTVEVDGGDITVNIAVTTTAEDVMDAVNADPDAAKLVRVSLRAGNTGAGKVIALTKKWVTEWSNNVAVIALYPNDRGY